jgi:alkanesulfonate monooxygenase SsuD/methylene tetrahydromethanopterin reductase-like flavin-dependent oxidoreductase (luciferase family)
MSGPSAAGRRPLRVGIQLPEVEREVRWPEILDMARAIEANGFDSLWLGEHLLYRWPDREPRGPWEAWTELAALAAVTERVDFGPLVACTNFHNPALLAKQAATIDEIGDGRFVFGLGAGWNETEFRAFGFPFDHRVDRFEEAFTIIRGLLQDGAIDFEGRYYSARDCELLPRPRPGGPKLLIGSNGPRMLRMTLPHVHAWNSWFSDIGNRPDGVAALRERVDEACRDVGRDPATIERTVAVMVRLPGGQGRLQGDYAASEGPPPVEGSPEEIAEVLRGFAREGIGHVQLVVDPITIGSIEALAPVLVELDRG